jgi:protein-S-isoprenylcysteine O-methyltransferase Ste14
MSQKRSRLNNLRIRDLALYLLIFIVMPVITYLLGNWFDMIFQFPQGPPFPYNLLMGFTIFFSGLTLGIRASRQLLAQGRGLPWGELYHDAQSTRLVTDGVYAYSRHPITLGYSLLPCGMGVMFQSLGMSLFIPIFVLLINIFWLKAREEPRLEQRFGDAYRHYKRNTPFLLPRLSIFPQLTVLQNVIRGETAPSSRLIYMLYTSVSILGVILLISLAYSTSLPFVQFPHQRTIILVGFDLI